MTARHKNTRWRRHKGRRQRGNGGAVQCMHHRLMRDRRRSTEREAEMPATLVAAPHNHHPSSSGIRHARKRMTQTPGRHLSAVIRSGARLISEWLRPNSRRPPGYSTAGGSLVVQFAILDARATQSVSLELLSSDQVPFCDRADFGGLGEGTGETTSPVWLLRSKVNSLWERGTARPRASWQDLGSRVAAA